MFEFSTEADNFLTSIDIETTPMSSQRGSNSLPAPASSLSHTTNTVGLYQTFGLSDELQTETLMQWPLDEHQFPQFDLNSVYHLGMGTDLAAARISTPALDTPPNDPNALVQFTVASLMADEYSLIPYIELPIPDLSPSPVPSTACSSQSAFDTSSEFLPASRLKMPSKIKKATKYVTKRGLPIKTRHQYEVNPIYEFMWENIAMSQNKVAHIGPGKHGVKILDHFGSLEAAKAHLADSKNARKPASRAGLTSKEARRQRDKRRDFFCFMPQCGLCFERTDKLERHLIETNVHGTIKPIRCSHHGCNKGFVDLLTYGAHVEKHLAAGHDDCFIPYPWHCPYPAVVEGLWRALEALPTLLENDSMDI